MKDSGGVIPGAEVTLTNQGTSLSRSTTTNEAGEYSFPNLAPGTYRLRIALQGYKAYAQESIPVGTQQFITLDITLEVGTVAETVTVTGQSPIIETSNASTGTVLNAEALQTLPSQGRAAFMIGNTVPTVVPSGDGQYNRQQDQTNVSLVSLGGGTRRGNNYTLDGVPITDMRNRASAHPSIESLEDMKVQVHTYDAEMGRTGGGVFNTTLKSGTNSYRGIGLLPDAADLGTVEQLLRRKGRPAETRQPVLSGRRRAWRADRQKPHVLLVHDRELPRRADAQRQHAVSDGRHAPRRLLRRDQCGRAAGDDLQPADRAAVCRQSDSVER